MKRRPYSGPSFHRLISGLEEYGDSLRLSYYPATSCNRSGLYTYKESGFPCGSPPCLSPSVSNYYRRVSRRSYFSTLSRTIARSTTTFTTNSKREFRTVFSRAGWSRALCRTWFVTGRGRCTWPYSVRTENNRANYRRSHSTFMSSEGLARNGIGCHNCTRPRYSFRASGSFRVSLSSGTKYRASSNRAGQTNR